MRGGWLIMADSHYVFSYVSITLAWERVPLSLEKTGLQLQHIWFTAYDTKGDNHIINKSNVKKESKLTTSNSHAFIDTLSIYYFTLSVEWCTRRAHLCSLHNTDGSLSSPHNCVVQLFCSNVIKTSAMFILQSYLQVIPGFLNAYRRLILTTIDLCRFSNYASL